MGQKPSGQPRLKTGILKWWEEGLSCGTETLTCGLWSYLWVGKSQNLSWTGAYISCIYLLVYENCLAVWEKEPTHCNGVQNHKGPMIRYNLVGINNSKKKCQGHRITERPVSSSSTLSTLLFCVCLLIWLCLLQDNEWILSGHQGTVE